MHDYGNNLGCGPTMRPTNPHPNSPAGRQMALAGTAPDIGGLLRLKSAAPIKPNKPQKACDHGLFSDEAEQLDFIQPMKETE